jgi:hypothetical protein
MSDVQQVVSKVKPNCTYTNTANHWAPLADKDNDDGCNEAMPVQKPPSTTAAMQKCSAISDPQ